MRLFLLLVLVVIGVLVYVVVMRASRPGLARAAVSEATVAKVSEIKELAWDHRELDPGLAGDLIERVRVFQERPTPDVLDDLLEIAWSRREDAPALSQVVIDTIRRDGGPSALE